MKAFTLLTFRFIEGKQKIVCIHSHWLVCDSAYTCKQHTCTQYTLTQAHELNAIKLVSTMTNMLFFSSLLFCVYFCILFLYSEFVCFRTLGQMHCRNFTSRFSIFRKLRILCEKSCLILLRFGRFSCPIFHIMHTQQKIVFGIYFLGCKFVLYWELR